MQSHYERLGISRDATQKEIEEAYSKSLEKRLKIDLSYLVLSNPIERKIYDGHIEVEESEKKRKEKEDLEDFHYRRTERFRKYLAEKAEREKKGEEENRRKEIEDTKRSIGENRSKKTEEAVAKWRERIKREEAIREDMKREEERMLRYC